MSTGSVTGQMARAVARRLAARGYRVSFPPGRDPAVFNVAGLPGNLDVEVTAEDTGQAACYYAGRSAAESAEVIARLPPADAAGDTQTAAWDGIEIEWHYQPPAGLANSDQVAAVVLAHLAVLGGLQAPQECPRGATSPGGPAASGELPRLAAEEQGASAWPPCSSGAGHG